MSTATQLYQLDDATYIDAYVAAIFDDLKDFLLAKNPGHCQRLDYLPRSVLQRLGQRLSEDPDLQAKQVICRVVTDESDPSKLKGWEATGSGSVALREDATYGRIRVFCALFPTGVRLAPSQQRAVRIVSAVAYRPNRTTTRSPFAESSSGSPERALPRRRGAPAVVPGQAAFRRPNP